MPQRTPDELRQDALAIWQAGLAAVKSETLVRRNLRVADGQLVIGSDETAVSLDLAAIGRIAIVGAGKAGAGMAEAVETALGERLLAEKQVGGWVNVPANCVRQLSAVKLHAARPAGINEPTAAGVAGAEAILRIVGELGPDDVCLCLISGGGSALLPAPVEAISLTDKQAITKHLSGAGANIAELNCVRKQLSRIKGGGLARACRAGRLVTLVISDVIGDPLDVIASGPTVPDSSTAAEALDVLDRFEARRAGIPPRVFAYLESQIGKSRPAVACQTANLVIGNNATAVEAAGEEALRRGYSHAMHAATELEGEAEGVGRHLAEMAHQMRDSSGPDCLITGGEPVVRLAPAAERGRGGRNQQLVLAGLIRLAELDGQPGAGLALLAGGTDGEDGPTDAAGAWVDASVIAEAKRQGLDPDDYLRRNDAYHFFAAAGGLLKTGPTHTNVCDLRVAVVDRQEYDSCRTPTDS